MGGVMEEIIIENGEELVDEFVEDESTVSPLTAVTGFKPLDLEENNLICQISPAKFDSLLKVLNVLITDKSGSD